MKAVVKCPILLELYGPQVKYDECNNALSTEDRAYSPGDILEFNVVGHPLRFNGVDFVEDNKLWDILFPDGSMAFAVDSRWFELANDI